MNDPKKKTRGSFGYDLEFLKRYDQVILLKTDHDKAQVIVSLKYQGKVFTSTAEGNGGLSYGWVNYKAFQGPLNVHMNGYGGENRFWLGPEGGRFSLFFKPGAAMVFENWKTPAAFDSEAWKLVLRTDSTVRMEKKMKLQNYKGFTMEIRADRAVRILQKSEIFKALDIQADPLLSMVGYRTENTIKNTGAHAWNEDTGMPCIWMLDMFKPTDQTTIVVPLQKAAGIPFSAIATTNYFGEIPSARLTHTDRLLLFKADGRSRGKLGIVPDKARPVSGSYDARHQVLTVTLFDLDAAGKYLNQEWNTIKPAFSGDAVNAYNDGPLANGSVMGPFYELESVSPAAFLQPGQSIVHIHSVFHFSGPESSLTPIAEKIFGTSIESIKKTF